MVGSWRKCLLIVTLLNVFILVRSSTHASMSSKNSSSDIDRVISVFRGYHRSPDRVRVCFEKIEDIEKFISRVQGSGMMNCNTNVTACSRENPGLVGTYCSCKSQSATYIVSKQSCVRNGWLRRDCAFRFGSWRFRSGWRWIYLDKPLLSTYIDDGYGITGGFNASTKKYESCSLVNIAILNQFGKWEMPVYDPTNIRFFRLRGYFHINWATEEMKLEKKQKLRGKLGRFLINCKTRLIQGDIVDEKMSSSCLPFKVTGNLTYEYNVSESSSGSTDATVAIVLGVVFPLLFIIVGLSFAIWFYRRK